MDFPAVPSRPPFRPLPVMIPPFPTIPSFYNVYLVCCCHSTSKSCFTSAGSFSTEFFICQNMCYYMSSPYSVFFFFCPGHFRVLFPCMPLIYMRPSGFNWVKVHQLLVVELRKSCKFPPRERKGKKGKAVDSLQFTTVDKKIHTHTRTCRTAL